MAGSVIVRNGHSIVEDRIIHNDETLTWDDADKRAGFRLDRRKTWAFITNEIGMPELCDVVNFTTYCTGCAEVPECTFPSEQGFGCSECCYTGKVRRSEFVPYIQKDTTNDR